MVYFCFLLLFSSLPYSSDILNTFLLIELFFMLEFYIFAIFFWFFLFCSLTMFRAIKKCSANVLRLQTFDYLLFLET